MAARGVIPITPPTFSLSQPQMPIIPREYHFFLQIFLDAKNHRRRNELTYNFLPNFLYLYQLMNATKRNLTLRNAKWPNVP